MGWEDDLGLELRCPSFPQANTEAVSESLDYNCACEPNAECPDPATGIRSAQFWELLALATVPFCINSSLPI